MWDDVAIGNPLTPIFSNDDIENSKVGISPMTRRVGESFLHVCRTHTAFLLLMTIPFDNDNNDAKLGDPSRFGLITSNYKT